MAELHGRFMDDPTPTDVLTFDLGDEHESGGDGIEGEIVISVETARREAKRRRLPERQEVLRYLIHGTLHLIGYDDATPPQRRRMRREEDRVLAELAWAERKVSERGRPQKR
jgi:probable rRNA maturation factor